MSKMVFAYFFFINNVKLNMLKLRNPKNVQDVAFKIKKLIFAIGTYTFSLRSFNWKKTQQKMPTDVSKCIQTPSQLFET